MKNHWRQFCLFSLLGLILAQSACPAEARIDARLQTNESMQEHSSGDPRRVMHDALFEEFCKGKVLHIVNPENSSMPVKYRAAPYVVGANLIAFNFAPNTLTQVSISIQLLKINSGKVTLTSSKAMNIDPKVIDACLKLHKLEFDQSQYGKALAALTREAAKSFEQKVEKLNLE